MNRSTAAGIEMTPRLVSGRGGSPSIPSDRLPIARQRERTEELAAEDMDRPAKLIRLGVMTHHLLDEVRRVSLDEAGRCRLRDTFDAALTELRSALPDELREELSWLTQSFTSDGPPTPRELQLAQAQLAGWLQGVLPGIQATLVARQIAAQSRLADMRSREVSRQEELVPAGYL